MMVDKKMYKFKVCPIQGRQLLDVRSEDIFEDFRICDTYRGGGGYDQLPSIIRKRAVLSVEEGLLSHIGKQFVVQLYGCHLRCPYCYVTRDGIFGKSVEYTAPELVYAFSRAREAHNVGIFHLMGGAPVLYMKQWSSIIERLPDDVVFTSDILLTENVYEKYILDMICSRRAIYAINIKGITEENYKENTGREIDWAVFWTNLEKIMNSYINFYLTFTNPDLYYMDYFTTKLKILFGEKIMNDSFIIDIKQYEAIKEGSAWS
jgi:pyruvate-formate lyase-activating enzyme